MGEKVLKNSSQLQLRTVDTKLGTNQSTGFGMPPVQVGGTARPIGPTHSQTVLMKHLHNQLTLKRSEATRSNEQLLSSEKVSPTNSQIVDRNKTEPSNQKSRPTKHDRKDTHSSVSFTSNNYKGSPLTSSWESFTRPVKLTERQCDEDGEGKAESEVVSGKGSRSDLTRNHPMVKVYIYLSPFT